jgi:hypothetical protein
VLEVTAVVDEFGLYEVKSTFDELESWVPLTDELEPQEASTNAKASAPNLNMTFFITVIPSI